MRVGRINLHVSEVDFAGLRFRAANGARAPSYSGGGHLRGSGSRSEPRELSGPPAKVITVALPAAVLDRLRVEADRRGVCVTALAAGLAVSAVPE